MFTAASAVVEVVVIVVEVAVVVVVNVFFFFVVVVGISIVTFGAQVVVAAVCLCLAAETVSQHFVDMFQMYNFLFFLAVAARERHTAAVSDEVRVDDEVFAVAVVACVAACRGVGQRRHRADASLSEVRVVSGVQRGVHRGVVVIDIVVIDIVIDVVDVVVGCVFGRELGVKRLRRVREDGLQRTGLLQRQHGRRVSLVLQDVDDVVVLVVRSL